MNISIGMSGYSYKEWKPDFYPADLKPDQMLRYYAERFAAVEINNTFYRMPTERCCSSGRRKCRPALFLASRRPAGSPT
jgi:uncharacterized protein YecE (DUF72 family)